MPRQRQLDEYPVDIIARIELCDEGQHILLLGISIESVLKMHEAERCGRFGLLAHISLARRVIADKHYSQ